MCQDLPLICNNSSKTVTGGNCNDSSIEKCNLDLLDASTATPVTLVCSFAPALGSAVASAATPQQPPQTTRLAQANSADRIVHNPHLQLLQSTWSPGWSLITSRIFQRTPRLTANRNRPKQLPFRRGPCDSISEHRLNCSSPSSRQTQTKTVRVLCKLDRQLPHCTNYHCLPCHCPFHTTHASADTNRAKRGFEAVSAATSPFQRLHTLIRETIDQLNSPP